MSINNPIMHEGYVPAYQLSATPWVTSSIISQGEVHAYTFRFATRFFNVHNRGVNAADVLAVSFTQRGLEPAVGNYFSVDAGSAFRDELRTTTLFVSCSYGTNVDYQIVAGLTGIPYSQFSLVTGSNGYGNVG